MSALKKRKKKANDCCRMCKCSFNVKYGTGKSGRMSTQNLYVPSNRDGSRGEVLACWPRCARTLVLHLLNLRVCPSAFVLRAAAKSGICASYLLSLKTGSLDNAIRDFSLA